MKGRILDYSVGFNRKQRITFEIDSDFRDGYDNLKDAELEIRVKRWKEHRSKDANAYFHVLVNEIAEARGVGADEVKQMLVVDYGTLAKDVEGNIVGFKLPPSVDVDAIYPYTKLYRQVNENGKLFNCYLVYKRSSDMDTKEMSRLIDGAIYEAKELGIDTDTPEQKIKYIGG